MVGLLLCRVDIPEERQFLPEVPSPVHDLSADKLGGKSTFCRQKKTGRLRHRRHFWSQKEGATICFEHCTVTRTSLVTSVMWRMVLNMFVPIHTQDTFVSAYYGIGM